MALALDYVHFVQRAYSGRKIPSVVTGRFVDPFHDHTHHDHRGASKLIRDKGGRRTRRRARTSRLQV